MGSLIAWHGLRPAHHQPGRRTLSADAERAGMATGLGTTRCTGKHPNTFVHEVLWKTLTR